ncbi:hypothetical protein SCB71_15480 [Herbiconiux sp. KACC 21604]|uniref:hypothetical protein n=1 Tax=unclassified Herbiconiux TaxID=2618217 RepID=UPI00149157EB|nr:hypothetical protein [Herbiconiux sp. SALV-R1]QJU54528.1 hypothetical protein HL652_13425 [Herbiconiux sp. SALV-R1]WPO85611.1 hypothetical protein SCB71_15480 [Herbiconiux sp. KACC 21604]
MGEKKWNNGVWEIDGVPITYRVTWKTYESPDEVFSEEFSDVDNGYDFYEMKKRSADNFAVTWDHIPW